MIAEVNTTAMIETEGYAIVEGVLPPERTEALLMAISRIDGPSTQRRKEVFAARNLLSSCSEVAELANSDAIRMLIEPILGIDCFPVRGILFDKIPDANWKVPWHQDVTIAVQKKIEVDGYGPWSVKADVLHVQPPASILERMLSVRLHLDDCGEENGALRVIAGSHRHGRISESAIPSVRERLTEEVCAVGRGGALLMRPLSLHASSASRVPGHRRVIHLDFASCALDGGLRWVNRSARVSGGAR